MVDWQKQRIAEERLRETERARESRERQREEDRLARERIARDRLAQMTDEKEKQRQHDRDMYERKFHDRQNEEIARADAIIDAEREKSQRDMMLARIDSELRERHVDVDFDDHVRRENIALQSHQQRIKTESDAEIERLRETSAHVRMELMANLRASVAEKFADHTFEVLKLREEAEIHEREMILGNQLAKDFKSHETDELIRLRRMLGHLTPEEFKDLFAKFEDEVGQSDPPIPATDDPGPNGLKG